MNKEFNPKKLLDELCETLRSKGKRKAALAESVSAIWDYLVKTPGEQRTYEEFSKMLGAKHDSTAFGKLKTLVKNGVIRRTSGRTAKGVGFICEWLEARRRGGEVVFTFGEDEQQPQPVVGAILHNGRTVVMTELTGIDLLAERGVQSVRLLKGQDSALGASLVEMLREIQMRVSKVMTGLADKR